MGGREWGDGESGNGGTGNGGTANGETGNGERREWWGEGERAEMGDHNFVVCTTSTFRYST